MIEISFLNEISFRKTVMNEISFRKTVMGKSRSRIKYHSKKHSHELKTVHESNIIQRKHMIEKSIHECKYQGMNGFVYELKNVHELNKIVHEWFLKSIHELK
jgi:hypothetical protein